VQKVAGTVQFERVVRIGEKMVSLDKAVRLMEQVLELRAQGFSQQEVAHRLSLDRSFISRLESVGELRKGRRVAVVGFPIANGAALVEICRDLGLDYYLILNNRERWDLVSDKKALDFFNQILEIITRLRGFDTLVLLTSERWYRLAEALLDIQIIFVNLGPTPLQEDCLVDPAQFRASLERVIKNSGNGEDA
jgi:transcriptional regulator with XRE-family HTH domain